ncbi:iron-containing alcohol dehydrogenase [uncultured Thomasclavelia sp.]|uniref:iron-containing alcohol dehydrogenase n=1 Tax=uncultured Thomasclavelia sp. TaxID=3025759 RepID=UPI0025D43B91|nr:iron-containing alcohol dehydrogenase [uncultured Thomasclavelia sp.]
MLNFVYQNPTKIIFGKGVIDNLADEILNYGRKVLIVYGGKSIFNNGLYQKIIDQFDQKKIEYCELANVTVPSLTLLYQGIEIAKKNQVDVIIGIGGGCCIDMAKSIAVGASNDVDIWDVLQGKVPYQILNCLPIGAVVTIAGSGSEMDGNSEIDNLETGEHGSIGSFLKTYPAFSILDPELTYSCPFTLTAYHGMTIIVQAMEQYLVDREATYIQDGFVETICKTVISSLRTLKENLHDYNARANLMWASAITCNRILGRGKNAPWLGGPLGGLIDDKLKITYAQGITITWPKFLITCYQDYVQTLKSFALNVMEIDPAGKTCDEIAKAGALALQDFVDEMGLAHTVKDLNCGNHEVVEFNDKIEKLASRQIISKEDIETIVKLSIKGE